MSGRKMIGGLYALVGSIGAMQGLQLYSRAYPPSLHPFSWLLGILPLAISFSVALNYLRRQLGFGGRSGATSSPNR